MFTVEQTHMQVNILFKVSLDSKKVTPLGLPHGRHAVFHRKDFSS